MSVALTFGFYLNPPWQPQAVFYHSQGKTRRAEKLRHRFFHIQDPSYFLQTVFQVVLVQNCIAAPTQPVVALAARGARPGGDARGLPAPAAPRARLHKLRKIDFTHLPQVWKRGFFNQINSQM